MAWQAMSKGGGYRLEVLGVWARDSTAPSTSEPLDKSPSNFSSDRNHLEFHFVTLPVIIVKAKGRVVTGHERERLKNREWGQRKSERNAHFDAVQTTPSARLVHSSLSFSACVCVRAMRTVNQMITRSRCLTRHKGEGWTTHPADQPQEFLLPTRQSTLHPSHQKPDRLELLQRILICVPRLG